MDKKSLLDRLAQSGEQRLLLARALDKYEQCQRRSMPTFFGFLSPAEQQEVRQMLTAGGISAGYCFLGGYDRAERRLLFFLPDWQEAPEEEAAMDFLRANFREGERLSHRDILGSLMALSIAREKIGDILLTEHSADLVVSREIADYLLEQWSSAGRVALKVSRIGQEELVVPAAKVKEIRDTVATLRLDAVTAAGFSISRTKAGELIRAGRVQRNYKEALKNDLLVAQGDVISARGLGKFELAEVGGLSKKGRTAILLRRYL